MVTTDRAVRLIAVLALIAAVSSGSRVQAQSAAQARIVAPIQNEVRVTVKNSMPALVKRSVDTGRVAGGQNLGRMILLLTPNADQEQAAAQLVSAQHDSSSPQFHKWLTPAQYGEQFGVAAEDAQKVQQWLQQQSMTVHEVSQSRQFVVFSGTAGQVEQAFSTQMHTYTFNKEKFVANSSDIQIPAALSPVVRGVVRLHSDPRRASVVLGSKVHFKKKGAQFTFDDGSHYLTPADFAKIYNVQPLYDAGIDGTGQTIAIVGRSNIDVENVKDFRSVLGLPANDPEIIVNGDDPGEGADMQEAMLDVTWSGAVAPMAHIRFVVTQSNFNDGVDASAAYIVDHNLAPVMSTSFGSCESDMTPVGTAFYNSLWRQAAAQGITSFVSSGDNGGAGCDAPGADLFSSGGLAVSGIASTPYNVAVGGTQFDDTDNPDLYWLSPADTDPTSGLSVRSYIPEKVWNESSNDPNSVGLWAGSGGVSTLYAKPDWQTASGVPNDGKRDIPDISLTAALHDGYLVCLYGYCSEGNYFFAFGGTSASSPAAAGIMALVNQKMGGQPQGIANYVFYKLASVSGVYHDVIKGDNKVPDEFGQFTVGYDAGTGYDLATGLGSFDATALVNNWQAAASTMGSATTLTLGNGQSTTVVHGAPINVHSTVNCSAGGTCTAPTGSVSLLATSSTGDGLAAGLGQLTPGTPNSTVNIQTHTVPGGPMTITARYSGDAKYYASTSGPINVTVTPEPSQTFLGMISGGYINNTPISVGYGLSVPIGVAVAGQSGFGYPGGTVNLTADGQSIEPAKYDYGTGLWSPYPIVLNYGEKSTLLTTGSNPASQSSSISTLAPGIAAGPHQLVASYPGDNSFGTSQASYNFTVTKADSMFQDFFPIGSLVANAPVKLNGQIGLANGGFAAYGGTVTITDITDPTPVLLGVGHVDSNVYGSFPVVVTFKTTGTRLIKAEYSGDANLNPTTSTYHMPIPASSSSYVSVGSDTTSAIVGSSVTLTATIGSDIRLYPATGTAAFLNGATTLGTAPVVATYLPGDPTTPVYVATLVTKALPPGSNNIFANYSGDSILQASSGGPAVVMVADYTMQAQPNTLTITSGMSGTATLTILPIGGSTQTVQVSCGTSLANISCSFTPASVTLDGTNPASVKITVSTRTTTAGLVTPGRALGVTTSLAFAALLLPFGRRRRLKTLLGLVGIVVIALYGAGCGSSGSSPNAQKGVYVLNVTTTSTGTAAKTTPLVVNIN